MAIPDSVASLLLKINSETDDGRQGLEEMAALLKAFGGIREEARADVETDRGERSLRDLAASLKRFGTEDADAQAGVDIARGIGSLTELRLALEEVDHTSVDADVDVDTGGALAHLLAFKSLLGNIDRDANLFTRSLGAMADKAGQLGEVLAPDSVRVGGFAFSLRNAAAVLPVIASMISAVVGGLVALASSLGAAIAGLGALAVAAGAVLGPAIGLVVAGIFRFKDTVDQAGTAAHQLAAGFQALQKPLQALLPAADPALKALVGGLDNAKRLIESIRPAFMAFGRQAGLAITILVNALTSGPMRAGISDLVKLASHTLPQLARIFGSVAEIVTNIARAAMPFLTDALKSVADALDPIAAGSQNITILRNAIRPLIGNLKTWLTLLANISDMFIQIGQVAAPFGRRLVRWFSDAAKGIADWADSAQGTNQIQSFLHDTLPLFRDMIDLIAQVGLALLQLGQLVAPVLAPFVHAATDVLRVLNDVLAFLNDHNIGDAIGKVFDAPLGPLSILINGFQKLAGAIRSLMPLLPDLGDALDAVGDAAGSVLDNIGDFLGIGENNAIDDAVQQATMAGIAQGVAQAAASAPVKRAANQAGKVVSNGVAIGIKQMMPRIRDSAHSVANAAIEAFRNARDGANKAGNIVGNAYRQAISATRGAASQAGKAVGNAATNAMKAVHSAAQAAGKAVGDGFTAGLRAMQGAASSIGRAVANAAANAMHAAASAARAAGAAVGQNFAGGIIGQIGAVAAAAARMAAAARAKLPGSEPKDHTSPLYGLGESGKSIVDNIVVGLNKRSSKLAEALASNFELALPDGRMTGDPVLQDLASRFSAGQEPVLQQNNYMLHPSDPRVLREVAAAANRGNGLRMTMPILRKNING